jgi:hypothetical protein
VLSKFNLEVKRLDPCNNVAVNMPDFNAQIGSEQSFAALV